MKTDIEQRLDARIHGAGESTVVLGNGFGSDQSFWRAQVHALVDAGFRVVTFDNAGATPHTMAAYDANRHHTLFGFAADLAALMQAMDIHQASYIGHSVAGMAGVLAANAYPGMFERLTLLGASPRYIDEPITGYVGGFTQEQVNQLIASMRMDYVAWANGFAAMMTANTSRPHLAMEFTTSLMALRPDIATAVAETIFHSDHRQDIARLSVPTQILQAAHDPAVPRDTALWLARESRAVDFQVLDTEGHFPHISAPDTVNCAILGFLNADVIH